MQRAFQNYVIYIEINTASILIQKLFNDIVLIIYLLNVIYFYNNFCWLCFSTDDCFLNVKSKFMGDHNTLFNKLPNQTPKNSNNFTDLYDEESKPYPKCYYLPDGKIISKDGDNISHYEVQTRVQCTRIINTMCDHKIDRIWKFIDNYNDAYTTINAINIKHNIITNPTHLTNLAQNEFNFNSLNTPISQNFKFGSSLTYASLYEINDLYYNKYYNIPHPHSKFYDIIDEISPYKKTTFELNDTWDDNISCQAIKNEMNKNVKQKFNACEIF